jgi:hypothetical protein
LFLATVLLQNAFLQLIKDVVKILTFYRLIYRLNFPANNNQPFSIPNMSDLLTDAAAAGLKVVGVTLNLTETGLIQFQKAVSLARVVFALGKSLGHEMCLLDLGEMIPNLQNLQEFEEVRKADLRFVICCKRFKTCC